MGTACRVRVILQYYVPGREIIPEAVESTPDFEFSPGTMSGQSEFAVNYQSPFLIANRRTEIANLTYFRIVSPICSTIFCSRPETIALVSGSTPVLSFSVFISHLLVMVFYIER